MIDQGFGDLNEQAWLVHRVTSHLALRSQHKKAEAESGGEDGSGNGRETNEHDSTHRLAAVSEAIRGCDGDHHDVGLNSVGRRARWHKVLLLGQASCLAQPNCVRISSSAIPRRSSCSSIDGGLPSTIRASIRYESATAELARV